MNKIKDFLLTMGLGLSVILLITGLMLGIFQVLTYFNLEMFPVMFGVLVLLTAFLMGRIMLKAYREKE
jgi:hypothetical protein